MTARTRVDNVRVGDEVAESSRPVFFHPRGTMRREKEEEERNEVPLR